MSNYLLQFSWLAPYPKTSEIRAVASNGATAVARGVREWRKQNGRKRIISFTVKVSRL